MGTSRVLVGWFQRETAKVSSRTADEFQGGWFLALARGLVLVVSVRLVP